MNNIILYLMGFTSIVVLVAGAALLVMLIAFAIASIWAKFSNIAHNVMRYLRVRNDFERYMDDFAAWENANRRNADKCRFCEYRKQALENEAQR